jgi:hypothetical protein
VKAQGRRREAGSERSAEQTREPMDKNWGERVTAPPLYPDPAWGGHSCPPLLSLLLS